MQPADATWDSSLRFEIVLWTESGVSARALSTGCVVSWTTTSGTEDDSTDCCSDSKAITGLAAEELIEELIGGAQLTAFSCNKQQRCRMQVELKSCCIRCKALVRSTVFSPVGIPEGSARQIYSACCARAVCACGYGCLLAEKGQRGVLALRSYRGNKVPKQLAKVEALLGSIAWPTDHPAPCKVTS